MTHSDYTKEILNIKDENIYFNENCLEIINIKGKQTKVFHGCLTYKPEYCPNCGVINESFDDIIKWGFKKNCKIKTNKVCGFNSLLILDKQRFYCRHCHSTFVASTNVVDFHKQISNDTKLNITLELLEKGTEKDIARRNNVSTNTVNRILHNISKNPYVRHLGHLPTAIGIDEFKATNDTISKMAFIIVNHDDKQIFDILNSRRVYDIEKYFKRYSKKERDTVKYITMDLYKPYYKLMKKLFRNAIIIPDRFHIVLQIRNALDSVRISLCNKSNPNYNKLKKYWKLILKKEKDLNDKNKRYSKCFKKEMTQKEIVSYLINTNKKLYETYNLYQGILNSLDNKDFETFKNIIHKTKTITISRKTRKAINTFIRFEFYIKNAFKYHYSNGIVEGINNLIKQVKHSACGYRKFEHLKARIMLIKGLYKISNITY